MWEFGRQNPTYAKFVGFEFEPVLRVKWIKFDYEAKVRNYQGTQKKKNKQTNEKKKKRIRLTCLTFLFHPTDRVHDDDEHRGRKGMGTMGIVHR
jgi:hypothetical protein